MEDLAQQYHAEQAGIIREIRELALASGSVPADGHPAVIMICAREKTRPPETELCDIFVATAGIATNLNRNVEAWTEQAIARVGPQGHYEIAIMASSSTYQSEPEETYVPGM